MTALTIKWTHTFKQDYKRAVKRGLDIRILDDVVGKLSRGETLPESMCDHELGGMWKGDRECHVQPDWLLVYRIDGDVLVLTLVRTGSHSDLFG